MVSKQEILDYLKEIKPELEKDGIINLGLFGSFAKDKADIASDIDIVLESTKKFREMHNGFNSFIYLDELREKLIARFKTQVDICNIASMPKEKQEKLLTGVIYV